MNHIDGNLPIISQWKKQTRQGSSSERLEAQAKLDKWSKNILEEGDLTLQYMGYKLNRYNFKLNQAIGNPNYKTLVRLAYDKLNQIVPGFGRSLEKQHLNAIRYGVIDEVDVVFNPGMQLNFPQDPQAIIPRNYPKFCPMNRNAGARRNDKTGEMISSPR